MERLRSMFFQCFAAGLATTAVMILLYCWDQANGDIEIYAIVAGAFFVTFCGVFLDVE